VEVRAGDCEERDSGMASSSSSSEVPTTSAVLYSVAPLMILADATGYSQASYNTTLGLFLLSLPGVWSLVKRATKSKVRDDGEFCDFFFVKFSTFLMIFLIFLPLEVVRICRL